jgi:putative transposase
MREVNSLSRTCWECKCHIAFIPKYRGKALFGQIRKARGGCILLSGQAERELYGGRSSAAG